MTKVPDAHRMPKILVSIVGVGHEWTIQAVVGVKCGFNDNVQVEFFKKNDRLPGHQISMKPNILTPIQSKH